MSIQYIYLGYGTTDENGECKLDHDANGDSISHSYTGTGAGKIDVVASLDAPSDIGSGSLVSETYELLDCIKIDNGIQSDYNNIWDINTTTSTITITRGNEYTEFKETGSNNFSNGTTGLSESCIIELDYWQLDGLSNTFMQILDSTNNQPYTGGINLNSLNGSLSTWYHLKITINNGTMTILNETNNTSINKTLTSTPVKFVFWSSSEVTTLRFKNFRIYPI